MRLDIALATSPCVVTKSTTRRAQRLLRQPCMQKLLCKFRAVQAVQTRDTASWYHPMHPRMMLLYCIIYSTYMSCPGKRYVIIVNVFVIVVCIKRIRKDKKEEKKKRKNRKKEKVPLGLQTRPIGCCSILALAQ